MPELVALMHSMVGMAAVLVGYATFVDPEATKDLKGAAHAIHAMEIYIGIFIGAVTFSGSVAAFGKLSGRLGGSPLLLPARHWLNLLGLLAVIYFGRMFLQAETIEDGMLPLFIMTAIALLFGIHMVMAIGGADMPVVVSMAVAQAQHTVFEITRTLRDKGGNVRFGIYPVAGRMPGHIIAGMPVLDEVLTALRA